MTAKLARNSWGAPYSCKFDWPTDCFVQCGGNGIVLPRRTMETTLIKGEFPKLKKGEFYTTAFFEAFPVDTFIRGEGKTIEEAEQSCWNKYQRISSCKGHEFEKRGYTNGAGFCKHCNMFKSKAFEPWEKCVSCGEKTFYSQDINDNWYCEKCNINMPEKDWSESRRMIEESKRELQELEKGKQSKGV